MSFSKPPAWIVNHTAIQNAVYHHKYFSADIQQFLNLPDPSSFLQGARQYYYWKNDLSTNLPKNTIVLAFLGPKGLASPNVLNVSKALRAVCNMSNLIEVFQGANSSFIGYSFNSLDEVSNILHNFHYFEDLLVTPIIHHPDNVYPFKLLWLPPLFNPHRVHHMLSTITSSYEIRRESIKTDDFVFSPSNIICGTLSPKEGKSVADLPHLITLPAPLKGCALLVISGRDPICLKCREIGHLRRNCLMKKCSSCLRVHFPTSPCGISSYASVTSRNITPCSSEDWLDHVTDDSNALSPDHLTVLASSSSIVLPVINSSDPVTTSITTTSDPTTISSLASASNIATTIECDRTFIVSTGFPHTPLQSVKSSSRITPKEHLDEANSSDDNIGLNTDTFFHHSLSNNNASLSDHEPYSQALSSSESEASISASDKGSHSSNSPCSKKKKVKLSSARAPSSPQPLEEHPINTSVEISTLSPPSLSLSDFPASPNLIHSYCIIHCLQCQCTDRLRWPLRSDYICSSCHTQLSTNYERRYYPLPDKAKITLSLSAIDVENPSSIFYLSQILAAKVDINPSIYQPLTH